MKKNLDFISRTKDILIVFFQKCTIISPLIICILLCSITAKAKKETLTANYVRQQKSNWCWAASAENSVRYERKTKRTHYPQGGVSFLCRNSLQSKMCTQGKFWIPEGILR